mgnify:CR=1 FL=1
MRCADESESLKKQASPDWLRGDLETQAQEHAAVHLVPEHLQEVRARKEELIDKTKAALHGVSEAAIAEAVQLSGATTQG